MKYYETWDDVQRGQMVRSLSGSGLIYIKSANEGVVLVNSGRNPLHDGWIVSSPDQGPFVSIKAKIKKRKAAE